MHGKGGAGWFELIRQEITVFVFGELQQIAKLLVRARARWPHALLDQSRDGDLAELQNVRQRLDGQLVAIHIANQRLLQLAGIRRWLALAGADGAGFGLLCAEVMAAVKDFSSMSKSSRIAVSTRSSLGGVPLSRKRESCK